MKRFFTIFTVFLFFLTGFPEITSCPGSEKTAKSYPANNRKYFLSGIFASRLKNVLRSILQEKAPHSTNFSIQAIQDKNPGGAESVTLKKISGRIHLLIPADFDSFIRNRKEVSRAVCLALLTAFKLPISHADKICDTFPVAALTHDFSETFFLQTMPYNSYTPGAAALTSYGILPDLEKVFAFPLPPDHIAGDLYREYSSILLSGILKRKLFSGADFELFFRSICENGQDKQMDILQSLLRKRLKETQTPMPENVFFHTIIRKNLSNALQPLSVTELEKQYTSLTIFEAEDHSGKKRKFSLPDFAKNIREVKNGEFLTIRFLQNLLHLSRKSPGNTGNGILWLRHNIMEAKLLPAEEGQKLIDAAEQQFFKELEKHSATESFLSASEKFAVTPGTRFFRTLELLQTKENPIPAFPWGSEVEKLLNDTEGLASEGDFNFLQ